VARLECAAVAGAACADVATLDVEPVFAPTDVVVVPVDVDDPEPAVLLAVEEVVVVVDALVDEVVPELDVDVDVVPEVLVESEAFPVLVSPEAWIRLIATGPDTRMSFALGARSTAFSGSTWTTTLPEMSAGLTPSGKAPCKLTVWTTS
jgi:hypothetical protein